MNKKTKNNYRAVQEANIVLADVMVPEAEKLHKAKDFATSTTGVLKHFWIFVAWMATGMAAGALEVAVKYYTERVQFKTKIQGKLEKCVGIVQ